LTASELRSRAEQEADELGPEPIDPSEHALWLEERRGAVDLLAGLGDWDRALLRRAALEVASEWSDSRVRELLLDAATVC
jgi:hypothetical protein